jgi:DNA-binding transcriptional regulator YiaG
VHRSDLRRLRKRLGLTTVQFAQALKVAQATVSRWETGERKIHPAFERLIKLTFGRASRVRAQDNHRR